MQCESSTAAGEVLRSNAAFDYRYLYSRAMQLAAFKKQGNAAFNTATAHVRYAAGSSSAPVVERVQLICYRDTRRNQIPIA